MKVFATDSSFVNIEGIIEDHDRIHYGESYILTGDVERTKYNGKDVTMVNEVVNSNGMIFVTDTKGDQPFAVFTNDSHRDKFKNSTILSKIVLKEGFFVVMSFYNENRPSPVYIFKAVKLDLPHFNSMSSCVGVKCVFKGNTLTPIPHFEKTTEHIVKVMKQINLPAQLQDKYCFQTTRKVLLCLMSKDERGEITSHREKKLVLNNNSPSRLDIDGNEINEGFFRVFYSRRFKDSSEVFVEGVRVDDKYLEFDIKDFINSADNDVRDSIRILTTKHGKQFYAIINNKGEVRPIIKLGTFTSFALSEQEMLENIVDIKPYDYDNTMTL